MKTAIFAHEIGRRNDQAFLLAELANKIKLLSGQLIKKQHVRVQYYIGHSQKWLVTEPKY